MFTCIRHTEGRWGGDWGDASNVLRIFSSFVCSKGAPLTMPAEAERARVPGTDPAVVGGHLPGAPGEALLPYEVHRVLVSVLPKAHIRWGQVHKAYGDPGLGSTAC